MRRPEELIATNELGSSLVAARFAIVEGTLAGTRGNIDEALTDVERGLGILEDQLGPEHPAIGPGLAKLVDLYHQRNDSAKTLEVAERELHVYLRAYGPDNVELIGAYNDIGGALHSAGDKQRAREYYDLALAVAERTLDPDYPGTAVMLCNIGLLAHDRSELELARDYFERCLATFEAAHPNNHPSLLRPLVNLGTIASRLGRHDEALAHFRRSIETLTAVSDSDADERHVWVRASYADALVRHGDLDEARLEYQRALFAAEATYGPDHGQVIRPLVRLAGVEVEQGELDLADAHLARARSLLSEQPWRAWELDFVDAKLAWARGDSDGLRSIREMQAEYARDGASYSLDEVNLWLARHGLSAAAGD